MLGCVCLYIKHCTYSFTYMNVFVNATPMFLISLMINSQNFVMFTLESIMKLSEVKYSRLAILKRQTGKLVTKFCGSLCVYSSIIIYHLCVKLFLLISNFSRN
jgi:hypothetical protein